MKVDQAILLELLRNDALAGIDPISSDDSYLNTISQ